MEELFRQTFDDSDIIAALDRIEKQLKETGAAGTDAANGMREAFSSAEKEVDALDQTIAKTSKSVSDQAKQVQTAQRANQTWLQSIRQTIAGQQIGGKSLSEWGEQAKNFSAKIKDGAGAIQGATVAQRIFNGVLKASGIGLLVGIVGSLISYFTRWQAGIDKVSQVMAGLGAVVDTIIGRAAALGSAIVKLFSGDFSGAANDAKQAVTGIGSAIIDAASAAYNLEKRIQALRDSTITASVEIARQRAELEKLRAVVDDDTKSISKRIQTQRQAADIEVQIAQKRYDQALEQQQIEQQRFALSTKSAEDRQKFAEAEIALTEAQTELQKAIISGEKEARDLRKSAAEQAKKYAEERAKSLEKERKELESLAKDLQKLRLSALGEGLDADLLAVNQRFDELIKTAQDGVKRFGEIEARRGLTPEEKAQQQAFTDLQVQIEEQRNQAILGVLEEYNQKELNAEIEQIERRKDLSEREQKDLENKLKAQKQLRDTALQIGEQQAEAYLLRLQQQGASEQEIADTRAEFDLEIQKARLLSEIEFQKKLLSITDAGNKDQIDQLNANIALLEAEVENVTFRIENKPRKPFSLLSLIGLDPEKNKEKIQAVGTAISATLDLIKQANQAEIERQQAIISAIDDRITKQEEAINREAELAKQGLANDLDLEKQRLSELRTRREQAAKDEAKARRAQIALDSVQQISSLVTASANIFKSVSALGTFGIPLAIGLIASMFGAFVAAKARALKAAEVPKFRKGTKLTGRTHEAGGNAILDGDGNVIGEAERGEWLIGTKPSQEHDKFLHRLNKGEFAGIDLNKAIPNGSRYVNPAADAVARIREIETRRADVSDARQYAAMKAAYFDGADRIVRAITEKAEIAPWKGGYKRTIKRGNITHTETVLPKE